jgi:hypothetical protein
MNHLDKFYKDKLNEREFEFDEGLWQDAEALIIADEKKKKRAFGWWFFGSALLISVVSGMIIWSINTQNEQEAVQTEIPKNIESTRTVQDITKEETNANKAENSKPTETISESKINAKITDKSSPKGIVKPTNTTVKEEIITVQNTGNRQSKNIFKAPVKKSEKTTPIAQNTSSDNSQLLNESNSADVRIPTQTVESLTQISLLKLNPFSVKETSEIRALSDFEAKKPRKLNLGLVGGIVYLPNNTFNSDLSYKGGLSVGILLKGKWELGTELSYFVFNNDFESLGESPQAVYGLGGDFDTYKLNVNNLHYLNLPIYAKYKMGYHMLECGFALDYLLGARGELVLEDHLQSWERDDAQNQKYSQEIALAASINGTSDRLNELKYREPGVIEKGWLDDSNLNKIQAHLLLGYQYRFNSKTNLGIRAQYRLTDFHKTNPDFARNNSKLSIHLAMSHRIF